MTSQAPDYDREPEAWNAYLANGNATQPRKRVSADVLLRDDADRILLVNPKYKPDWDLPGGMTEANEPPHQAARREVREELGIEVEIRRLLCIDWVAPHGPWDDLLAFIFDGGVLTKHQVANLKLADDELHGYEFCHPQRAEIRLRPYVWRRVTAALNTLANGEAGYLIDGRPR